MVPKMKEKSKMSPIMEDKPKKTPNAKTKSLKDRLREEDQFAEGLINMMYIPKHKLPNQLQEEVDEGKKEITVIGKSETVSKCYGS